MTTDATDTRIPLEIARDGLQDAIDAAIDIQDAAGVALRIAKDEVAQLKTMLRALPKEGRVDGLIVSADELTPATPAKPKEPAKPKRKGGASGAGNPPRPKRKPSPPDPSIGPCRRADVLKLFADGKARTTAQIAAALGTSSNRASACLNNLLQRGQGIARRTRPENDDGPGTKVRSVTEWFSATSETTEPDVVSPDPST